MQESVFVHVGQATNGSVFGVDRDGVVTQFRRSGVRKFATCSRGAADFDDCDVDAVYLPTPPPDFSVTSLDLSDDARGVLLHGGTSFGALRLDRRREGVASGGWEVPFRTVDTTDGAEVVCARWMSGEVGSFCVLRRDGTLSVHDSAKPEFAARIYRLRRYDDGIGVTEKRRAGPVDLAFLPASVPWGRFCALILYRDGCLFTLCPLLAARNISQQLLKEAERQRVSPELLTALAMEKWEGEERSYALDLRGPVNRGLRSEWEGSFAEWRCDSAVTVTCTGCGNGFATVAIGTASGIVYHHIWIGDVTLQMTLAADPKITNLGVRLCPLTASGTKLRLVETIHLQKSHNVKEKMQMWQDNCSLMYCRLGVGVFRVRFNWVTSILSGTIGMGPLGRSDVWMFTRDAECLGTFHDLDASIAVFRHEYRTTASIFRPGTFTGSSVNPLPPLPLSETGSLQDATEDFEKLLMDVEDPAFEPVKKAFRNFMQSQQERGGLVENLEQLQDQSVLLQEQTSELESMLDSLTPQTAQTLRAMRECARMTWSQDAFCEQFNTTTAWLDDSIHNNAL